MVSGTQDRVIGGALASTWMDANASLADEAIALALQSGRLFTSGTLYSELQYSDFDRQDQMMLFNRCEILY